MEFIVPLEFSSESSLRENLLTCDLLESTLKECHIHVGEHFDRGQRDSADDFDSLENLLIWYVIEEDSLDSSSVLVTDSKEEKSKTDPSVINLTTVKDTDTTSEDLTPVHKQKKNPLSCICRF